MISRKQYSSDVRLGTLAEDPIKEKAEENGAVKGMIGIKRKEFQSMMRSNDEVVDALSKLEMLDLDSDEEELLLNVTEEEEELIGIENLEEKKNRTPRMKAPQPKNDTSISERLKFLPGGFAEQGRIITTKAVGRWDPDAQNIRSPSDGMTAEEERHMKWLRTVVLEEESGQLKIVAAGPRPRDLDAVSESGQSCVSGKTESLMADTIKGMIDVYMKRRAEVVTPNGFVSTPLHVVKTLAMQHGEALHCEAVTFKNGYHRVELFSGSIRGIGEGMTKRIAAQMAAIDMMERIQLSGGAVKVPTAAFLPGWLTSNQVFADLRAYCEKHDLPPPRIKSELTRTEDGEIDISRPKFKAQCWVGDDYVTIGVSETDIFARREAAKEMIFIITNQEYKDTPYGIGTACRSLQRLGGPTVYHTIMSDFKKKWLFQNRVQNNHLVIPEDEVGIDHPYDLKRIEEDIEKMDELSLQLMTKKETLKVRVNKKMKTDANDDDRNVVVEKKAEEEDEDDGY